MIYLEKHNGNRGRKLFVKVTIGFCLAIVLIQIFLPHIFQSIFMSVALPFWRAEFSIESGSLDSPAALLRENEMLKQELVGNNLRMNMTEYVDFENSELRSLLGIASSSPKTVVAVLKRPPLAPYDELIIDAGLDRHLSTSTIVFIAGNIPIGRVTEVSSQSAKVLLFSSPGQKQDILIGQTHIAATATGRGGGQYEAELPKGLMVNEGDYVISGALDARPMGQVISVNADTAEPFQKILFAVPVNIYELRWVSVDTGKKK